MCGLCGQIGPVETSHIVPRFVTRWLQRTSATGHIRRVIEPNLRVQDPGKMPLLCKKCEGVLSRDERWFSEKVFIPYLEESHTRFTYGEALRRFVVGLAWRSSRASVEALRAKHQQMAARVEEAMLVYGDYLLGRRRTAGPYEHHVVFLAAVEESGNAQVPDGFQWYLLRTVDSTLVGNKSSVVAYTKFPGFIFWSPIEPCVQVGWQGTLVEDAGVIGPPQNVLDGGLAQFLVGRTTLVEQNLKRRSAKQVERIFEDMLKQPRRALQSRSHEAHMAEEALRAKRRTKKAVDADEN